MNESRSDDERSVAERSREGEDVRMADLGDAKVETKQWAPFPFVRDNLLQWGWS